MNVELKLLNKRMKEETFFSFEDEEIKIETEMSDIHISFFTSTYFIIRESLDNKDDIETSIKALRRFKHICNSFLTAIGNNVRILKEVKRFGFNDIIDDVLTISDIGDIDGNIVYDEVNEYDIMKTMYHNIKDFKYFIDEHDLHCKDDFNRLTSFFNDYKGKKELLNDLEEEYDRFLEQKRRKKKNRQSYTMNQKEKDDLLTEKSIQYEMEEYIRKQRRVKDGDFVSNMFWDCDRIAGYRKRGVNKGIPIQGTYPWN